MMMVGKCVWFENEKFENCEIKAKYRCTLLEFRCGVYRDVGGKASPISYGFILMKTLSEMKSCVVRTLLTIYSNSFSFLFFFCTNALFLSFNI